MKWEHEIAQGNTCHYPDNWARSGVWNSNKIKQILSLLFVETALILAYKLHKVTIPKVPFIIRTTCFLQTF